MDSSGWTLAALTLISWTTTSNAQASTYVVDDNGGPGVDFTDVQSAVDFAQPGDVLLVQPGTYDGFTVSKGLTIIGSSTASIAGTITVTALPTDERAAFVRTSAPRIAIMACDGTVILDDLGSLQIEVDQSHDVRMRKVGVHGPYIWASVFDAVRVAGSRVEINDSDLYPGSSVSCFPGVAMGRSAVHGESGSRIHVARSQCWGGLGSGSGQGLEPGPGGSGIRVENGCEAIVAGGGASSFRGANGQANCAYTSCQYDGFAGSAMTVVPGGALRYSAVVLQGGYYAITSNCDPYWQAHWISGTALAPLDPDPTLRIDQAPLAGGSLKFTVAGTPGSLVTLVIGNDTVLIDDGALIEQLASRDNIVPLGKLPLANAGRLAYGTSGQMNALLFEKSYTLPVLPVSPGSFMVAQAELTLPNGELRRTNSVPVVVR